MFDVAPTELLLCAIIAILVIGPKDLPAALRLAGRWTAKMRGMMRQVRSGFDAMVREAELEEMEKKWAEHNARIMREHGDAAMKPLSAGESQEPVASESEPGERDAAPPPALAPAPAPDTADRS